MGFASKYLEKHQFLETDLSRVSINLGLLKYIIVIPAFCEPDIFTTLNSICTCNRSDYEIEVFVLINYSEDCSVEIKEQNIELYNSLLIWALKNSDNINLIPLIAKDLPAKHAGVGLARKILMDSACKRFDDAGILDGLIISLDADSVVPLNYLTEIDKYLEKNSELDCLIFNFAHPINGNIYSASIYNAIALYELHLRYYKQILDSINFPYSVYTIGSCFAIKAQMYIKVGGMSRRKAGEDFYFLHKVLPSARTAFLKNIVIIPSPRPSWRVPFGTGPAIMKISNELSGVLETYHPQSFYDLQFFLHVIPDFYGLASEVCKEKIEALPIAIKSFLLNIGIIEKIHEINNNSASESAFTKRLYNWFNAFIVLKYLNFARDNYYGSMNVIEAVKKYLQRKEESAIEFLSILRERDKN